MFAKKRHAEKALMKKTIAMHEERDNKHKADDGAPQNALPAYLLERDQVCSCQKHMHTTCRPSRGRAQAAWQRPTRSLLLTPSWRPHAVMLSAGGQGQGAEQHHQAEAKGEGRQVGGAPTQGETGAQRRRRGRRCWLAACWQGGKP